MLSNQEYINSLGLEQEMEILERQIELDERSEMEDEIDDHFYTDEYDVEGNSYSDGDSGL